MPMLPAVVDCLGDMRTQKGCWVVGGRGHVEPMQQLGAAECLLLLVGSWCCLAMLAAAGAAALLR